MSKGGGRISGSFAGRIAATLQLFGTLSGSHKLSEQLSDLIFGNVYDADKFSKILVAVNKETGLTGHDLVSDSTYRRGLPYANEGNVPLKNLDNIKTVQGVLSPYRLGQLYIDKEKPYGLPLVVKYQGQYIIRDGNHRFATAILNGNKTIKATILDADKLGIDISQIKLIKG